MLKALRAAGVRVFKGWRRKENYDYSYIIIIISYYYVLRCRSILLYRSICFRRKMSTFVGQADRHRGVVVKSTIAATEQEKSTEFGPKLASNFLHVFLVLFQGRRVVFGPLVPKRGRGRSGPLCLYDI